MLDVLLCLACLAALCLFFASLRGVSSASAPLLALCCAILWFAAFGMLGLLRLGGGLFYGVGLGLGGLALFKGRTKLVKNLFSPGLLLFFAGAVVLAVWLGLLQPQFTGWDEYSSWGIAAKITKVAGQLYPVADSGFRWTMTEYPALVVLGYFAQFFGAFAPWKVFWAYGLLYLACVAAMLAPFGKRQWRIAVPLAVCGLALPFFFSARYETVELAAAWLSAYADLPGGMLFGGVLCLYFGTRQSRGGRLWQVLPPLAVLGIVKENIMPVALVAAGVFACDTLFFGGAEGPARGRALAKRLAWCVSYFAVVLIPFLAWKAYAQWANTLNPIMNGAQTNDVSATDALAMALREVFGPEPLNETARQVLRVLADSFLGRVALGDGTYATGTLRASMAGTGLVTLLFIVAVFAVAVLLAKTARRRGRIALAGGLLLGGFFAFHFMLFVTYAYISHQQDVFDYHRYIATYTTGWLMLGLGLLCSRGWLCRKAAKHPSPHPATSAQCAERSRRCGLGRGLICRTLILALACFMFWRCAVYLRPGYSVLDAPKTTWDAQRARQAAAQPYADAMGPQGRAFFVCQGGLGNEFMEWHYDLYPTIVMDSVNGGRTLEPPPADAPPLNDYASLERVREYLVKLGCDYILIDAIDEGFVENYGVLFADLDPAAAPALYRLGPDGLYARVEV